MRRFALAALLAALSLGGFTLSRRPVTSSHPTEAGAVLTSLPAAESVHLAMGLPTAADPSDDYILRRPQYVVGYSRAHNGPSWAAWRLTAADFGGQARHRGHFITDASLPDGWYRVRHEDYTGTGYDRGHLVRSEDRTTSQRDNEATFLLSNVLPQRHDLNAGPWLRLEDACRTLAQHDGRQLFILAGGTFTEAPATLGHGVSIPAAFWKVVVVLGPGQGPEDVTPSTRTIAVVMPNVEGIAGQPWTAHQTTIAAVERASGYQLLGRVAEPVRHALETAVGWRP